MILIFFFIYFWMLLLILLFSEWHFKSTNIISFVIITLSKHIPVPTKNYLHLITLLLKYEINTLFKKSRVYTQYNNYCFSQNSYPWFIKKSAKNSQTFIFWGEKAFHQTISLVLPISVGREATYFSFTPINVYFNVFLL